MLHLDNPNEKRPLLQDSTEESQKGDNRLQYYTLH